MWATAFWLGSDFCRQCGHTAPWVGFLTPFLSGPAGFPRECFSLIGTGLTGLLGNCSRHGSTSCIPAVVSWAPSIFSLKIAPV